MAPQANSQQAVLQGFAYTAQGPTAPAHGITKLVELDQIDFPLTAEHQAELGIGRGAEPVLLPVEAGEELGRSHRGGCNAIERSCPMVVLTAIAGSAWQAWIANT